MRRVFKYPVQLHPSFTVAIPAGARFLSVQEQHGKGQMWFEVEDTSEDTERSFVLVATGEVVPVRALYLGTFQLGNGSLVLHLYEGAL